MDPLTFIIALIGVIFTGCQICSDCMPCGGGYYSPMYMGTQTISMCRELVILPKELCTILHS
jgi:hypothetical protein